MPLQHGGEQEHVEEHQDDQGDQIVIDQRLFGGRGPGLIVFDLLHGFSSRFWKLFVYETPTDNIG